jgi:hypothetical protein
MYFPRNPPVYRYALCGMLSAMKLGLRDCYLLWQRMYAVVFYPSIDSRTGGGSPTACNRLRLTADL